MSSRKKRFTTVIFLFFFFQAEDGIRDADVTGVQTCALPIFRLPHAAHGLPDEPQVRLHPASRRSLCDQSSRGRQRSEEHTSELQSRPHLVCRLLLEKKKKSTGVVSRQRKLVQHRSTKTMTRH